MPGRECPAAYLLDAPTELAACCGFDLRHKYTLYLNLYLYFSVLRVIGGVGAVCINFAAVRDRVDAGFFDVDGRVGRIQIQIQIQNILVTQSTGGRRRGRRGLGRCGPL